MPSASMQVRTNIATQTAHREMRNLSSAKTNAAHRLSSGFRINSAADDPAGLAISETMTSQIRGLDQASVNAQDGISMLQTAEGAMEGIGSMLHRIRELLVQAANDTNTPENRKQIDLEIQQLIDGIDDMATRAEFNTRTLLDGTYATADPINWTPPPLPSPIPDGWRPPANWPTPPSPGHMAFITHDPVPPAPLFGERDIHLQIGANSGQGMSVGINGMTAHHLGLRSPDPFNVSRITTSGMDSQQITRQIEYLQEALDYLNNSRAMLGSIQVRLEHSRQALDVTSENLSEARSRVRDADMAREMMDYTQMNILFQSGISMLAHGNRLPDTVLSLLR